MLVKISKYVESSTGRPALRIEFHDQAIQAMAKLFGKKWQFTPMMTKDGGNSAAIMLTAPTGHAATYRAKESARPGASKKTVILHDFHFKGQTISRLPNFPPAEVVLAGPETSGGIFIRLPDRAQTGEANPQIDMFAPSARGRAKVQQIKSMCDLTLRFADGTKMVRSISMVQAAEIIGRYLSK